MGKTVAIGIQDFEKMITDDYFYIDKTDFIREWWEAGDDVTLITRPRRFGKTLNMSMLEAFFSVEYADRGDLFEELSIWNDEKYRALQGTYPVIFLSFARIKENTYEATREKICEVLINLYSHFSFLKDSEVMTENDRAFFERVTFDMSDAIATSALYQLSDFLYRYYGKKVIILLDEYDTPMQEAYVQGFWDEMVSFTRSLFNSTFKTNPYIARGIMTGITRVSKESIFSDLNNLKVVTTTSDEYATAFGFTEQEVFSALDEYGYSERKSDVKSWYDGFIFGKHKDIYNPWSILNFLDTGELATYWANTSSNSLVGKLVRESDEEVKGLFESLLKGEHIYCPIDEQIVFNQLDENPDAIWSLLLASGYLKVLSVENKVAGKDQIYEIALTNAEVLDMFYDMVRGWFKRSKRNYNGFIKALFVDNLKEMNIYMNQVALQTFSFFDSGTRPSDAQQPENFYHGFVLGLLVELSGDYTVTSNRESGYGRYDVMIEPLEKNKNAYIFEFKVHDPEDEATLKETVQSALVQIEEKQYAAQLIARGIPKEHIRSYGFAFEGKKVLIG
ncbi:AAA family ATPase [Frisingicoccus sp.]|uniref:AAA family ATPase n=1 Tax=Frisingicoccus sp. TaxID=1918627 RepID=UPI002A80A4A9|nr:AAA family ATPase [Frisingicoccus sp.]MCI7131323.1 ATP-binding protein [Lachnospiraceae bacterium]MDY4922578.1 AAA family ATPase [Frisingicoccus sp.]